MPKKRTWNRDNNSKLLTLLDQGKRRGIDPFNLDKEYIEGYVIKKFFPDRVYETFSPLYCQKIRQYNLNKSLEGVQNERKLKSIRYNYQKLSLLTLSSYCIHSNREPDSFSPSATIFCCSTYLYCSIAFKHQPRRSR